MACYHPLTAWRSKALSDASLETGKVKLTFNKANGVIGSDMKIPCGQCIGCRLERSRQWAIRCIHEASQHEDNRFVTLTYDDEHLPAGGSLDKDYFTRFMKRLRKWYGINKLRYFQCGEYGDTTSRPHHHACLFGIKFPDEHLFSNRFGVKLYHSEILDNIWQGGFCTIGDVNFLSAAYAARYVLKKITGKKAEDHYHGRHPEYITMSRRPGIGRAFLENYMADVFNDDTCIVRHNLIARPPKYYDRIYDSINPEHMAAIKEKRRLFAEAKPELDYKRLETLEESAFYRMNRFKRQL